MGEAVTEWADELAASHGDGYPSAVSALRVRSLAGLGDARVARPSLCVRSGGLRIAN
jgi:hypothetical protein